MNQAEKLLLLRGTAAVSLAYSPPLAAPLPEKFHDEESAEVGNEEIGNGDQVEEGEKKSPRKLYDPHVFEIREHQPTPKQ